MTQPMSYTEALAAVLERLDRLEEFHEQGGGENGVAAALAQIVARQDEQARRQDETLSLLHELDDKVDQQCESNAALLQWREDHERAHTALESRVKSNTKWSAALGSIEALLVVLLGAFQFGSGVKQP